MALVGTKIGLIAPINYPPRGIFAVSEKKAIVESALLVDTDIGIIAE